MNSEQRTRIGGAQVGEPGQGMLTAARIFSNYVLAPPRRHPDEAAARASLHGAALLVFADKSAQQVELRTGDATHVRRDAGLRPAEKLVDESVSGHNNLRQIVEDGKKEKAMSHELHCSTCDAVIPKDAQNCPGCGLQLTAQAVPAVYVEHARFSLWQVLLVAGVVMLLALEIFGRK